MHCATILVSRCNIIFILCSSILLLALQAIEAATLDKDNVQDLEPYAQEIDFVIDKLNSLLLEMEECNQEDNQDLNELNDILIQQQDQLNQFTTFVQSVAAQQQAQEANKPEP